MIHCHMVVLTTAHKFHCILWEQVAIFNKGIGFLYGLKFLALNTFYEKYLQPSLCSMLQICLKRYCQRWTNEWLWASKYTCPFISYLLKQGQHPISRGKLQVLSSSPNIHQSGYSQIILLPHVFPPNSAPREYPITVLHCLWYVSLFSFLFDFLYFCTLCRISFSSRMNSVQYRNMVFLSWCIWRLNTLSTFFSLNPLKPTTLPPLSQT